MDGIIFDVDGTLWDSTDVVALAYNLILEKYTDTRVDGARLKQLFGKPMDVIFQSLIPDATEEERKDIVEQCLIAEEEQIEEKHPVPYDGVKEMLQILSEKYPLFIVSNCQCGYIEQFLRLTGNEKYITDTLCFGQTGTSKGQTILKLMEKNNLKHPVYVGDTQGDADACKEAGIPFIFAEYGFGSVKEADGRIAMPMDLIKSCLMNEF